MITILTKKTCVKCATNSGVVTCDGCHQSFCQHHLSEHQQELVQQMDRISDQCELFRQGLLQQNDPSPILSAIDLWEEASIKKIQLIAKNARTEVHQLTKQTLKDFNESIDKITTSMESSRKTSDATEIDIKNWTRQFQTLQELIKQPFPIGVGTDEKSTSIIRFIKITYDSLIYNSAQAKVNKEQQSSVKLESHSSFLQEINTAAEERFYQVAGRVKLAENGSVATCVGYSSIYGIKLYASGKHSIRFRVVAKKNEGIFFGILTSAQEMTARSTEMPSAYGWRDFDRAIINGNAQLKGYREKNIEPDDQMTLTIDCDHTELALTHHRLKKKVQLSVDLNNCPLPWRLLVTSYGEDIISIVR
ncbi:unnamed protein product [Rotaria sp. Silwood2]|nr:unnamed protein product [Rotaria sp. Silwood2]CAF2638892.1 unnamed protein product [Rotaria sp. Silwood2]CAF2897451.1 unnamed protein product [Rotaria sp. Silwood2]CAF3074833.1 unnamed protein product [Rotaria sp. Silwood2]CAF3938703.1 unnamed protein product [Rotaria sp. Silwood2]